jgi:protein-S-isoprenylcysteine O-methyltransferase Ste14
VTYALAALTIAVGAGSLIGFTVFLYTGSLHLTEFGLAVFEELWLNACLCLAFFIQHSGMIRKSSRRWLSQVIPERYLGVMFTLASSIALLALIILWQESTFVLASADGTVRGLFRVVFFLALAANLWGTCSLKSAEFFGTDTLLRRSDLETPADSMVVRGPYRWIRHPLYLSTLLMIWSHPDLSADRMLFNLLFTVWIIAGTLLEERDLVGEFGDDYREYQRSVPMLIPYRRPSPEK